MSREWQVVVSGNKVQVDAVVIVAKTVVAVVAYVAIVARLTVARAEYCVHRIACVYYGCCCCRGVSIDFAGVGSMVRFFPSVCLSRASAFLV